jgi:putative addiction module component (TIGR02574 family)
MYNKDRRKTMGLKLNKDQILANALELPPVERAQLIEELFASFNFERNIEIDEIWKEEIVKRVKAYEAGTLEEKSIEEVFSKINK